MFILRKGSGEYTLCPEEDGHNYVDVLLSTESVAWLPGLFNLSFLPLNIPLPQDSKEKEKRRV